jgi:hypothetical protein
VFAAALRDAAGGGAEMERAHYQSAFQPMMYGVALAVVLTFFLEETGTGRAAAVEKA